MSFGGSSSGSIAYPAHMMVMHKEFLAGQNITEEGYTYGTYSNIADDTEAARAENGGSPYANIEGYDPKTDLNLAQQTLDEALAGINEYEPHFQLAMAVDAALEKYDGSFALTDDELEDAVSAFETRSVPAMQHEVSRVATGFFDLQATMSSQYAQSLALMEIARQQEVNNFEASLHLQRRQDRMAMAQALINGQIQLDMTKLRGLMTVAGMQAEQAKLNIMAWQDKLNFDLQVEARDATWDLDLYAYRSNVMSSIAGSATVPHPSAFDRALQVGGLGISGLGMILQLLALL